MKPTLKQLAEALLVLTAVIVACAAGVLCSGMPAARPADAPAGHFSSARAMEHVRALSVKSRPAGSEAKKEARDYILRTCAAMGINASVQASPALRSWFRGFHTAGHVENIIAVVPGSARGRSILFVAHYDSVPTGPGAADDISGAAAMLETMRALQAEGPPKQQCVFLFTDGEEYGLLGACAFVRSHPVFASVEMTVNLEARGIGGPSVLIETGPGSGRVLRAFADLVPDPVGNSLAAAVNAQLPNDTDFSIFRDAGAKGLNFAFFRGVTAYHTALDSADRLDPRTLQHHGEHVLSLARGIDFDAMKNVSEATPVYFNPLGSWMLMYGRAGASVFTALCAAGVLFLVFTGLREKSIRPAGLVAGFVAVIAVPAALALVAHGVIAIMFRTVPSLPWMIWGEPYNGGYFHLALALLSAGAGIAVFGLLRRTGAEGLAAGGMLAFAVAAAATAMFFPVASFMFHWPLFWAVIAGIASRSGLPPRLNALLVTVVSVPAVIFAARMTADFYTALTLRFAAAAVLSGSLYVMLMAPLCEAVFSRAGHRAALVLCAAGVAFLVAGIGLSGFDEKKPRPDAVSYVFDADRGESRWVSCDPDVDERTSPYFGRARRSELPLVSSLLPRCFFKPYATLVAEAPDLRLPPPRVTLAGAAAVSGGRKLTVKIQSPRKAAAMLIVIRDGGRVREMSVDGIPAGMNPVETMKPGYRLILDQVNLKDWTVIQYSGLAEGGVELGLSVNGMEPVELRVIDVTYGTPAVPPHGSRPKGTIPASEFLFRDAAMAGGRFSL